eukprot:gnl/TRDRNA2_/TRDRNA2_168410_c0_seq1.p1 gnl/TRDRNA2_/TRDRNA2_168410_c0~~gnl/TRDRNA2_/TRDRNA2_168410_c0_seq1.p1  ORF type:complete len:264 (+),score=31.19 gnl/TRDRNA2_/TRDRNA2_168410_c0_seq1:77-793(+)
MVAPRIMSSNAVVMDKRLIICGGKPQKMLPWALLSGFTCDVFDGSTWRLMKGKMFAFRAGRPTLAVWRGQLIICGGDSSHSDDPAESQLLSSCEIYDGSAWKLLLQQMPSVRPSSTGGVLKDKLFVCGSANSTAEELRPACSVFDGVKWSTLPMTPGHRRHSSTSVVYRDQLWVCGGDSAGTCDVYAGKAFDLHSSPLLVPLSDAAMTSFKGELIMTGGDAGVYGNQPLGLVQKLPCA